MYGMKTITSRRKMKSILRKMGRTVYITSAHKQKIVLFTVVFLFLFSRLGFFFSRFFLDGKEWIARKRKNKRIRDVCSSTFTSHVTRNCIFNTYTHVADKLDLPEIMLKKNIELPRPVLSRKCFHFPDHATLSVIMSRSVSYSPYYFW